MTEALIAQNIFTGEQWLHNHAVMLAGDQVGSIVPIDQLPAGCSLTDFEDNLLAPGFIDLQIYGANGHLLAVQPTVETLTKMYDYCLAAVHIFFNLLLQPTHTR